MKRLLRWQTLVIAAAVVVVAVVAGFGPLVRSRARAAAERYGAEVEIDWVLPAWGGVTLDGVKVRHPDAPSVRVELDHVKVGWGSPRRVEVRGGTIELSGSFDELAAELEKVRARKPDGAGGASSGGLELSVEGVNVTQSAEGMSVAVTGTRISRSAGLWSFGADKASVTSPVLKAELHQGGLEIESTEDGYRIVKVRSGGLDIKLDLGGAPADAAGSDAPAGGGAGRIATLRRALSRFDTEASRVLGDSGRVELEGVRAEVRRGDTTLAVGPATIRARREDGHTLLEYLAGSSATGAAGADGLAVRTKVPGPGEPLSVEVHGGPIALSTLGVREGDLHIVDPKAASIRMNAKVEVDEHGEVGSFDGEARISDLGFHIDEIAKDPVRGLSLSFRGKVRGALDGSKVTVSGGEVEVGNVRLVTSFDVSRENPPPPSPPKYPGAPKEDRRMRYKLDATYEVPLVPCQALVDAAPHGLLPTVEGMRIAGSFSLKGKARVDTLNLDRDFAVDYDVASSCRVTDVPPAVDVARFKKAFTLKVYGPPVTGGGPGEKEVELETGPGTGHWASYSAISRFMEPAVMTCEDGRFHRHEGFDHEAIRNSIRENIRQRRFVRGASTISMQLAKNLYLERDKRLGRKIEEAFLTLYLEQALTKEQILELYLNVVELGPKVYGVEAGAQHYFRTSPSRLTLSQAFYLASILPSPRVEHFGAGGAISPGWLKNLRTLMKHANKVKRLSDEDLEAGLAEVPLRGSPAPLRDPEAGPPPADDGTVTEIEPQ